MSHDFLTASPGDVCDLEDGNVHVFDDSMIHAVNAAIATERPLLVRGETGVGKSQLARAVAQLLGRVFLSKTMTIRSEAEDLLWHFDAVRRLADAQVKGALAAASQGINAEKLRDDLTRELAVTNYLQPGPLWWAFNHHRAETQAKKSDAPVIVPPEGRSWSRGCVLLIDEIDKAESDVPNGLLEALGSREFTPLGFAGTESIKYNPHDATTQAPLIIITTNEERALPDAFVRRCFVLHLALPDTDPKEEFLDYLVSRGSRHFPDLDTSILLEAAEQLRKDRITAQKIRARPLPGQAEYIDLLRALHVRFKTDKGKQEEWLRAIQPFVFAKQTEGQ